MIAEPHHDQLVNDLPLLVGDGLAAERKAVVRDHLATCAGCLTRYFEFVDAEGALRRAAAEDPHPPDGAVLLRGRLGLGPVRSVTSGRRRWAIALAASALLAFVAGLVVGPFPDTMDAPPLTAGDPVAAFPDEAGAPSAPDADRAYRDSLEPQDQLSRGLVYLARMERNSR
jgi:anti-sigma factor RsiW